MCEIEEVRQKLNNLITNSLPAPLEDPRYIPRYPPVKGAIPWVIEKWGPRSQYRWFRRYHDKLNPQPHSVWANYYCDSLSHKGLCCASCIDDIEQGYEFFDPDRCCCKASWPEEE